MAGSCRKTAPKSFRTDKSNHPMTLVTLARGFASGRKKPVSEYESTAIFRPAGNSEIHVKFFQNMHLSKVFNFIFHNDRTNFEPDELARRKPIFREVHHPDVGGFMQVGGISHMGVKIHVPQPASRCFWNIAESPSSG